jgi:hypothetical protein
MKEIFQNCLFPPGTKVTVTDRVKHRHLVPGSTCFVSRLIRAKHIGLSPNMITLELVVTKNGKRGKDRVDRFEIATTVFPVEFEQRNLKSNKYKHMLIVELESVSTDTNDVMKLSPMDFIGWGFAYKLYVRSLYSHANIGNRWPRGAAHSVNGFGHVAQLLHQYPAETIESLSNPVFRTNFTEQIRILEAGIIQYVLESRLNYARQRLMALAHLIWTDKRYKKEFYDPEQLVDNYNYYRSLFRVEQNLRYQISARRWASFPAQKRDNIPKPNKPTESNKIGDLIDYFDYIIKKSGKLSYFDAVFPADFADEVAVGQYFGGGIFEIQEEN